MPLRSLGTCNGSFSAQLPRRFSPHRLFGSERAFKLLEISDHSDSQSRVAPMDRNPNIAFGGSVLAKLEGVNLAGNLFEQILPSVFKNNLLSLHEVQGRALFTSE